MCYNIVGEEKSNKLEDTIYKYAPLLENDYSDTELDNFLNSLKRKTPTLKTFKEKFKTLGWSNHYDFYKDSKNKDRVKIVLELLEGYYSGSDFIEEFTLEHIYPDSKNTANSQIGNIIPLERNLNEKCKDKELIDKLKYYENSNFKLARNISDIYKDNEFDPEIRADQMSEVIYRQILHLS